MPALWPYTDRRWSIFDRSLVVLCLLLFTYNVLAWQRLVGGEPPFRPLTNVLVSGALLLQALGAMAQRRRRWLLFYVLLAASLVVLGYGVMAS